MITKQDLIDAGYRLYDAKQFNGAQALYQKCIYDGNNKLYYISIFWFDFKELKNHPTGEGWQPEIQFNRADGTCFNVTMLTDKKTTVNDIAAFYSELYDKMGCVPYEISSY